MWWPIDERKLKEHIDMWNKLGSMVSIDND